ncbi:MAG: CocE/NonD family hydrolase [Acidobacteria bacterium]|nr:MAG: CocE/NonD family hydrolase [Acidobacteriota bacterium]
MRRTLLVILALAAAALAQTANWQQSYSKRDVMIPMRDGVRLHTEIYTPHAAHGPLPFLITRTPYGLNDNGAGYSRLLALYPVMEQAGYIFVMQDIRGRYGSDGKFIMQRPPCAKSAPHCVGEATDTYDTVAWLLTNVPNNNGRAGLLGISYGGWLTTMALLDPNPALKAVSEQASPADMFLGDDFHHNGAFRLSYGFEYVAMMETGNTNQLFHFPDYDTYGWYLKLGSLANVNQKVFHGQKPTWDDFVNHPNQDWFWNKQSFTVQLKNVQLSVPDLNVAGWWDQEDFYGPVDIYETLLPHDVDHYDYLAIGPWNHGGWSHGTGEQLGPVHFGSDTSAYFRAHIQAPWFAYWLKGEGAKPPHVRTFATGSNQWQQYDAWPPAHGTQDRALYLHADHSLSFARPTAAGAAFDSYTSDPAHPVPYRHRPVQETYGPGSQWYTWLLEDQRFVDNRPDTATWTGPVLTQPLCIAGNIQANLYASTTGSDSDWVVKLIDVYPQKYPAQPTMAGYELMIADEIFRGRFRQSFEHPEPIPPNKVELYDFSLHTNDHCFLPGHAIMVQVQSTWFPLYDRNPQTFVPNIFLAPAGAFRQATQRIYASPQHPSSITLPVRSPAGSH